MTVVHVPVVKV